MVYSGDLKSPVARHAGSSPATRTNSELAIVQWIVHRASTSRMWVRFLLAGPIT